MSQVTVVTLSPDQIRELCIDAVRTVFGDAPSDDLRALERLKKKSLLTPKEVEDLYGLNARTLSNKRGQGIGPAYVQEHTGGPVFYEHEAIQNYIAQCRKRTYE